MALQPIPPPGLPGPQNKSSELLAVLARFAARARLTGPRLAGVPAQGQMAAFKVGALWVPFWINPMTYRETTAAIKQEEPTMGLVRRAYFSARPTVMSLEGTTGTAGWDARTGGMADLGRMKPFVASPTQRIEFHYPYMFSGPRYCYVNRFVQQTIPDAPLYYYYQIEMTAYPKQDKLPCRVAPQALEGLPAAPTPAQRDRAPKPKKVPVTPALARTDLTNNITATVPIQQTVTLPALSVPVKMVDPRIWWATQIAGGGTTPPTVGPVPTTATTKTAGAALYMASALRDTYIAVIWAINKKRGLILLGEGVLGPSLKAELVQDVLEVLVPGSSTQLGIGAPGSNSPATQDVIDLVVALAAALATGDGGNLRGLNGPEYIVILCQAFNALLPTQGSYDASLGGTRDTWQGGIQGNWTTSGTTFLPWQLSILVAALTLVAEDTWKHAAQQGLSHPADLSAYCMGWPTM